MSTTPQLGLPLMAAAQAQKHVTHNEALFALDAVVQCAVLDKDLGTPPASPAEGDRYIVGPAPTGEWAGKAGLVVLRRDGAWLPVTPRIGFLAYVVDEALLYVFTSGGWTSITNALTAIQNLGRLGIGTAADATNPFAAKLNKALWTARESAAGGTGDLRYTLNKEAAANVLSLLFQTNYSGRLELGLVGSDNLVAKVSSDGATWRQALAIDAASGGLDFLSAETTVASAATVDLGALPSRRVAITGTTAIVSFGPGAARERLLRFTDVLTLTHHATSLILPGGASIVTAAGDTALVASDPSGNWRVLAYGRASGRALAPNLAYAQQVAWTFNAAGKVLPVALANTRGQAGDAVAIDFSTNAAGVGVRSLQIGAINTDGGNGSEGFVSLSLGDVPTELVRIGYYGLRPSSDDFYDLGSSSKRLKNAYLRSVVIDPTFTLGFLSATVPSLNFDGGDALTYDRTNNVFNCYIGGTIIYSMSAAGFLPYGDNARSLGSSSYRWTTVYAGTGTINTSDAREKTPLRPFTDAELDAWGEVSAGVFQFLDAVAAKGADRARLHFGYIAQDVEAAFARHGIDARRCALWCADPLMRRVQRTRTVTREAVETVEEESLEVAIVDGKPVQRRVTRRVERPVVRMEPVLDEAGRPVMRSVALTDPETGAERTEARSLTHPVPVLEEVEETDEVEEPTGEERLGLRYDQCHVIEAAWQRRRADRIEARLAALEDG